MDTRFRAIRAAGAVFVASDVVAFGAMACIRECGLSIPQISVVGFDDVPCRGTSAPSWRFGPAAVWAGIPQMLVDLIQPAAGEETNPPGNHADRAGFVRPEPG